MCIRDRYEELRKEHECLEKEHAELQRKYEALSLIHNLMSNGGFVQMTAVIKFVAVDFFPAVRAPPTG